VPEPGRQARTDHQAFVASGFQLHEYADQCSVQTVAGAALGLGQAQPLHQRRCFLTASQEQRRKAPALRGCGRI
jgi:hypothetical protein